MSEFLPAIAPDQDRTCAVCGIKQSAMPGHEEHHWIPRSLGGTETITLCVRCHEKTEGHQPWKVGVTPDYVFAQDAGGKVIVKRWKPPAGFDQAQVLAAIESGSEALASLATQFRYLDQDGVEQVAEALGRLGRVHWLAIARLVDVAHLSSPYGSKQQAITSVINALGLERRTAYYYREAMKVWDQHANVQSLHDLVSPGHLLTLAKAPDPEAAVALLTDRLAQDPAYSVADYRREVRAGVTSLEPEPQLCECPTCGHRHRERGE